MIILELEIRSANLKYKDTYNMNQEIQILRNLNGNLHNSSPLYVPDNPKTRKFSKSVSEMVNMSNLDLKPKCNEIYYMNTEYTHSQIPSTRRSTLR